MRKFGLILVIALTMVMMMTAAAFAAHSDQNADETIYQSDQLGVAGNQTATDNAQVHAVKDTNAAGGAVNDALDCAYCHENQTKHTSGPHGGYTTTSNKCLTCHGLHARPADKNKAWSARLLPGETTVQVCNYCHDLTQSDLGPYYGHYMSGQNYDNTAKPKVVKSAHRITGVTVYNAIDTDAVGYEKYDGTFNKADLIVPGGDQVTGGDRDLVTGGQGALSGAAFTCDSCHTPHAITGATVDPYLGESHIKFSAIYGTKTFYADQDTSSASASVTGATGFRFWLTDRLLKARIEDPNKVRTVTDRVYTKYNSDWCASCHQGRFSNDPVTGVATVHNHPVSVGNANPKADGYKFSQLATYVNGWTKDALEAAAKTDVRDANGNWVKPTFYATSVANAVWTYENGWNGTKNWMGVPYPGDVRTNEQFAMTAIDPLSNLERTEANGMDGYINIADAAGGPSCQQCHGSARDIEQSFHAFETAVGSDQLAMNFPHVSENKALLVEEGDDFCTNCHGLDNLP